MQDKQLIGSTNNFLLVKMTAYEQTCMNLDRFTNLAILNRY